MKRLILSGPANEIKADIHIGGSKSLSNRVLIIRSLCLENFPITNLSTSDDTQTLEKLLTNGYTIYDALHAGTTFRFLTAFLAFQKGSQTLTGSSRMLERPVGPLVKALRELGCNIDFIGKEGYPPLRISAPGRQVNRLLKIRSDVSSQFISALCLVAPTLPLGLKLVLEEIPVSVSYIKMTLATMEKFGIRSEFDGKSIDIQHQSYKAAPYFVESDWSSAGYFYAIAALRPGSEIRLNHFFRDSVQGDSEIHALGRFFGVHTEFEEDSILIRSTGEVKKSFHHNFINQPDLAQTLSVLAAGFGMTAEFTGLQTLKIKETDRIKALQNELSKIKVNLKNKLGNSKYCQDGKANFSGIPSFATYDDHRMAMSLSALSLIHPIEIQDYGVISKSYPEFWDHLELMGFDIVKKEK